MRFIGGIGFISFHFMYEHDRIDLSSLAFFFDEEVESKIFDLLDPINDSMIIGIKQHDNAQRSTSLKK